MAIISLFCNIQFRLNKQKQNKNAFYPIFPNIPKYVYNNMNLYTGEYNETHQACFLRLSKL